MESTLEGATQGRKRAYSPRNRLRRDMVSGHPVFELFVSGSSTGSDKLFHCMICQRDVSMESRGPAEFARHFFGKRHWVLDVTYRVQNDMPVFNRLMDPVTLVGIFDFLQTGLCTLMVWAIYDWVFFYTSWSFVSCCAFAMLLAGF